MDAWWGTDNEAAEAVLVKGCSSRAGTAAIVATTHFVVAKRDLRVFHIRVISGNSISEGRFVATHRPTDRAHDAGPRAGAPHNQSAQPVQLSQVPLWARVASCRRSEHTTPMNTVPDPSRRSSNSTRGALKPSHPGSFTNPTLGQWRERKMCSGSFGPDVSPTRHGRLDLGGPPLPNVGPTGCNPSSGA